MVCSYVNSGKPPERRRKGQLIEQVIADGSGESVRIQTQVRGRRSGASSGRLSQGFFTPAEIAVYMGMATYTVQELCRRGELRHVKVGRSIRIRREWADQFMADREREPLQ